jgi:hypothetical protein
MRTVALLNSSRGLKEGRTTIQLLIYLKVGFIRFYLLFGITVHLVTSSALIDTDGDNVKDVVHLDTSSQISTQRTIAKEQTLDPDVPMFLAPSAQVQDSNEMVQRTVQITKPTKSVSGDISRASKNEKGKERPRRKKRRQAISHSHEQESLIILEAPPRQGKATELENPLPIDLNELATETKITSDHNQMPEIHAEELVPTEIERPGTSAREQCKAFEPPSGYRTIDSLQLNQEQSVIGIVTWAKGVTESKGTGISDKSVRCHFIS